MRAALEHGHDRRIRPSSGFSRRTPT